MKLNIAKIALAATLVCSTGVFTGCSEEKVYELDAYAVPEASNYADAITIDVDQETNIATFKFNGEGVYPVWIIDGKTYSTAHSFSKYYRKKGEYNVEVKIANGNGMSQGTLLKTFEINKTIMNGFSGYQYDYEHNLWLTATQSEPSFYYAPGWAQIDNPAYSFNGDEYNVSLPSATTDQWQAQMHVTTDIVLEEGETYDWSMIVTSTKGMGGMTVKIHPEGDDGNFIVEKRFEIPENEPICLYGSEGLANVPYDKTVFTFDFGGCADGTDVTIENIVIKNHKYDDGTVLPAGPSCTFVDVNSDDNLWKGVTFVSGTEAGGYETWTSGAGWDGDVTEPTVTIGDNNYTIYYPRCSRYRPVEGSGEIPHRHRA